MRARITPTYREWIDGLRDRAARARVQVRVDRLVHGHAGTHRYLKEGISELKIDYGPGYRVYYTIKAGEIIVLGGGDKSTQRRDIEIAIALARTL